MNATLLLPSPIHHGAGRAEEADETICESSSGAGSARDDKEVILQSFRKDHLRWNNIDWVCLVWMIAMHAGALAAPFFFSWSGLGIAVLLHWLTASFGICLCYHRYLTHRSLKMTPAGEFFTMTCAVLSGQGSPLDWTATHRLHHQLSDQPGDPHSPREGAWWSHILWLFVRHSPRQREALFRRYVPDLVDRPIIRFFQRTEFLWQVALGTTLLVLGGWSFLLWGLCLRIVFAYHSTWFVNSATHLWGYRNYETTDDSKNLWWVALLSYGEGWHNNHHAHPNLAPAGHRWWEIDMTWWAIKAMRLAGLAYDVNDAIPEPVAVAPDAQRESTAVSAAETSPSSRQAPRAPRQAEPAMSA
ncbi:MAG TPA: fatty acid desaturase [Planctomycetaceae bacterium]|nr:fatty acid desaturase [Planctomycetaceae bacterium]